MTSKVMLMPDNQRQTSTPHIQASSTPSTVERRPHADAASSRSRMSIIVMDNDSSRSMQRPPVAAARRRPTVKKYTIDDFKFIKVLGKGSFGKVHHSVCHLGFYTTRGLYAVALSICSIVCLSLKMRTCRALACLTQLCYWPQPTGLAAPWVPPVYLPM